MAALANDFKVPFAEQVEYFRGKLNLPTERWDDVRGAAHDRAFIVAGAAKADLLQDLRDAVDQAIAQGTGLEAFRKDFAAIIRRTGWDYTGAFDWRTRVIYQTNLNQAYMAGRYKQLTDPALLKLRPYWKYIHADGVAHPRPLHVSWNGLILRHDDAWWQTHFPGNEFGCHCRVKAVSMREAEAAPDDRKVAPDDGSYVYVDRLGNEHLLPRGVGYGFDHIPGAAVRETFTRFIQEKLIRLDAPIGAAMMRELEPLLAAERQAAWVQAFHAWRADGLSRGRTAVVGAIKPDTLAWLDRTHAIRPAGAEILVRDDLVLGPKARRHEGAGDALSDDEWRDLPRLLAQPDRIYLDTTSRKLVSVSDVDDVVKVVVEFDAKVGRRKDVTNLVVTAFRISAADEAGAVTAGKWVPQK